MKKGMIVVIAFLMVGSIATAGYFFQKHSTLTNSYNEILTQVNEIKTEQQKKETNLTLLQSSLEEKQETIQSLTEDQEDLKAQLNQKTSEYNSERGW